MKGDSFWDRPTTCVETRFSIWSNVQDRQIQTCNKMKPTDHLQ